MTGRRRPSRRTVRSALVVGAGVVTVGVLAVLAWPIRYRPLYNESVDPASMGTVSIADPSAALTFARTVDEPPRLLLVTAYQDGTVSGVDLSDALGRTVTDPIEVLADEGYERLAAAAADIGRVTVPVEHLGLPADLGSRHIATGLNFAEHASEVGVNDGPFLFPKLVTPTAWNQPVHAGDALLDYEAEVAWVPLTPIGPATAPSGVGMILINDYTGRAILLQLVDTDDASSGAGFTTAKSAPGYLPVGDLFVVPRDPTTFADSIELSLYVNGDLRQRCRVGELLWDLDEIVDQTFARRSLSLDHRGHTVSLLDGADAIPARSLLLTGTPEGTVYTDIDLPRRISGFLRWLAFGWSRSIPDHAIDAYIGDARAARIYLQPRDRVTIRVDTLGVIDTHVTEQLKHRGTLGERVGARLHGHVGPLRSRRSVREPGHHRGGRRRRRHAVRHRRLLRHGPQRVAPGRWPCWATG